MPKFNFWGCLSLLVLAACSGCSDSPREITDPPAPPPTQPPTEPPVENTAPSADAGTAATVMGGTVVVLDGSSSSDADGDALTYSWSVDATSTAHFVDDDGELTPTLETATGKLLIPASEAGKEVIVSLAVSDGESTASDTLTYSVEACPEVQGYIFTECLDPSWLAPMARDVNFENVDESFGYFGGNTDNHVRWSIIDSEDNNRGRVFDVTFNKESWNGSFRIVPAGRGTDPNASVDLSSYADGNLVFDLRVVEPTNADIYIAAECVYPCEATPRQVTTATDGSWSTVSIPLAEFNNMDWSKASIPFSIYPEWGDNTQTGARLQVDNIRLESASCVEEENVIFDECLGPNWYTLAAVDDSTVGEYREGNTGNHIQWSDEFSGNPQYGDVLAVQFTTDATNGHFYIRTESREQPNDMSAYINGALVFDIKVQSYGSNTDGIVVRVDTWWDGETSDEILLPEVTVGDWKTVEIPVSDLLVGGGLDLSSVHVGFSIWPAGSEAGDQEGVEFLLDNIRWEMQLSE